MGDWGLQWDRGVTGERVFYVIKVIWPDHLALQLEYLSPRKQCYSRSQSDLASKIAQSTVAVLTSYHQLM